MHRSTTAAIVLRSVNYGEADRVVTLLGRDTGKFGALARSARKSTRRFAGLAIGARGEASFRDRPNADLAHLETFEVTRGRLALGSDVARTAHAAYALELIEKLSPPRHRDVPVFDWLDALLDRLEAAPPRAERLRVFELGLLARLGLAPALSQCAVCGETDPDRGGLRWDPGAGGVVCAGCERGGAVATRALTPEVRAALVQCSRCSLDEGENLSLPALVGAGCRDAMVALMEFHVGAPLKTVTFIAKLAGA